MLRGVGASPGALVQLPRATRDLVFGRETPAVTTKALLEQYAGSYFSDELDARYVLVPGDSTLIVKHRKLQGAEMSPAFTDAFTVNFGATALFVRDKTRHVTGFILSDGRVRGLRFVKER